MSSLERANGAIEVSHVRPPISRRGRDLNISGVHMHHRGGTWRTLSKRAALRLYCTSLMPSLGWG